MHVRDALEAATAIRAMRVRGAPAIGVTAAYAMALAARSIDAPTMASFLDRLDPLAARIAAARPTAVNLGWAVQRCVDAARACRSPPRSIRPASWTSPTRCTTRTSRPTARLGRYGAPLLPQSGGVLTHCNTGALATAGYGTALGVIRTAWENGNRVSVFCTETRPWLQGARLTTWELARIGIPATLIVDAAAAALMASGEVGAVVVGADRITANGDVANKVGHVHAGGAGTGARAPPLRRGAPLDGRPRSRAAAGTSSSRNGRKRRSPASGDGASLRRARASGIPRST